jgi:PIN domain nuclease of toxin-antitoxin system
MSDAALDASAILAFLFNERGADKLTSEILASALVSTVNLAEVQTRLVKMGRTAEEAWLDANSLGTLAVPYSSVHAKIAGDLIAITEPYGLSLGDRSCLALAIALDAPVYTTEKIWKNLNLGIPIHVIR